MARRTKYTPVLVEQIIKLLEDGNTDNDTCGLVGIGHDTFYAWIEKKPEFSEAVSHARGIARQRAVDAYRAAMKESQEKTAREETYTEIRLDRNGTPYEYKRTTVTKQVTTLAPDWRAAESYLKRRDPEHWAETFIIKVSQEMVDLFKKFDLTPAQALEEYFQELARVDAERHA